MPFHGKRRRSLFLVLGKKRRFSFNPSATSTPAKSKKQLLIRTPGKSPTPKRTCMWSPSVRAIASMRSKESDYDTENEYQEDTWLYSESEESVLVELKEKTNKSRKALAFNKDTSAPLVCTKPIATCSPVGEENPDFTREHVFPELCHELDPISTESVASNEDASNAGDKTISELMQEVMIELKSYGLEREMITFLQLVAEKKFPLNNVAFMLFLDVVKWFDSEDVRRVRYNDTTLKFFWLGKRLFGGRFLRFMSGPKNETDFVMGKRNLSPNSSKINFACPSDRVLSEYNPLGYGMCIDNGPGLINEMIEMTSKQKSNSNSFVLMFDGKKIKRGTDTDLLGFEPEPQSTKTKQYESDLNVLDSTIEIVQNVVHTTASHEEIALKNKEELGDRVRQCFDIVSKCLMHLRRAKTSKEYAMFKYKEKVRKDPSLSKTLQFAMDACRTALYIAQNSIETMLAVQWEICKAGAFLNGAIETFAPSKRIQLKEQLNVNQLKSVEETKKDYDGEELPTKLVRQRSDEWFEARKTVKVTGSVLYGALGCDGLKRQNEHFDSVFSDKAKHVSSEQQKAMSHGVESEVHEIATLSSVIIPFLFPELNYNEEGYYIQGNILVSPDGSLTANSRPVYAVEGKAPSGTAFATKQHYSVPERYILQTLFEQRFLSADKGTVYICWTPESTTAFIVPTNEDICCKAEELVAKLYHDDVPKRRTKLLEESKTLKKKLKEHVGKCIYLGEFPSVEADECQNSIGPRQKADFDYTDLARSLLKAKAAVTDAYQLGRNVASQVLVYLLADLDRYWKSEVPHAVPVMYGFRGYSLSMDIARQLLDHCWKACTEKGIDVVTASSDGEFVQLIVKGKKGQPLTLYQLSKEVWKEVCKYTKAELVKKIASLNKTYKVSQTDEHRITLESKDDAERMRTPMNGWKNKSSNSKEQSAQETTTEETECEDQEITQECDDTISYDYESVLELEQTFPRPITHDEAHDILTLLKEKGKGKWKTVEGVVQTVETSLVKFTKDELVTIARYLNLKLIGTKHEIKVTCAKKSDIVDAVRRVLKTESPKCQKEKRRTKISNPKPLQVIATEALKKASYPKQVLNIAYATYTWPKRVKKWREDSFCLFVCARV